MELLIFYIVLALGVSFLCSILEAVFFSVTLGFVQQEISSGKKYAKKLAKMKENVDEPLSAILTLNTIAHTMGAAGAGAQWNLLYDNKGEAFFAGILTLLILILSEIIPKTLGAKLWRQLASPTTSILSVMVWTLTYPMKLLKLITRLIGGHGENHGISRAELSAMAEVATMSGDIEDEERQILHNLFLFKSTKVRDIMTPRTVVYAVLDDRGIDEVLQECMQKSFSRIPLYSSSRDNVIGFILKSDLMSAKLKSELIDKTLTDLMRPIKAVNSSDSIFHAFKIMTQNAQHIMLVIDDFGGMEGVVSMEDIVETLLGMEIVDEADKNEDMQVLARSLWQKRAKAMGIDTAPITSEEK
jgi:CBS domain containing-hemolysin-like protein